jgi:hypothetical protein
MLRYSYKAEAFYGIIKVIRDISTVINKVVASLMEVQPKIEIEK